MKWLICFSFLVLVFELLAGIGKARQKSPNAADGIHMRNGQAIVFDPDARVGMWSVDAGTLLTAQMQTPYDITFSLHGGCTLHADGGITLGDGGMAGCVQAIRRFVHERVR